MGKAEAVASRTLSWTEISTALTCFARWDFSYGGRLTGGDTLKPRETAPILSDGRAWGAAVAAWHAHKGSSLDTMEAHGALIDSLRDDAVEMREHGFQVDPGKLLEQVENVGAILDHYMATAEQMALTRAEEEINVPLLSRSGRQASSRYRYHCFIDGHTERGGHPWIVEFKLRGGLTPVELIEKAPQYRWYAWARRQMLGWPGAIGVYVEERLKEAPKPPRLVKAAAKDSTCPVCQAGPESPCVEGGKPTRSYHDERKGLMTVSHAVDQITTPELYEEACRRYGVEPNPDTTAALGRRTWQQRVPLIFTPDQLDEAGRELTSVAQTIRDLDAGRLYPIRHGTPTNCRGCRFKAICSDPTNEFMVSSLFERTVPKRDREAVLA